MMPKSLQFWFASSIALGSLAITSPVLAQPIPDATLPVNSVVTTQGNTSTITGGTRAGRNLFHSFREFSVSTGSTAYFNNSLDIQNIISRVTGKSVSNIDGLIKANGGANLFLINPNGIMFGPHASLNLGGSFLASTANSLKFADGTEFSATTPETTPLLTMSVPIGLQLGISAGSITNQSVAVNSQGNQVGLQVLDGNNLTLVGGNVSLEDGNLTAAGGRVELGGLSQAGMVGLNPDGSLSFPVGVERADVSLTNQAQVDVVTAGNAGSINITARNIDLQQQSLLLAGIGSGLGAVGNKAGDVTLNATNAVSLSQASGISNQVGANATGDAGDINVTAGALSMTDGSLISAGTLGQGNAGNINIQVGGDVTILNADIGSQVLPGAQGKGGNIVISTGSLSLADGAQITTINFGQGNAGNVRILTSGNISFDGGVEIYDSGVFASVGSTGMGNGGDIYIQSSSLSLTNGGEVVAGIFQSGQGNSGNVMVNVKNSISISGVDTNGGSSSGLFSDSEENSQGQAGEIILNADALKISDGGTLSARTRNAFRGGDIIVQVNNLELTGGGQILTAAFDKGNAGDITINATKGTTISGSDPTFYARLAQFGRPLVDPVNPLSGLFANTNANSIGNGGAISVDSSKLTIANGAQVAVSSLGQGQAGDISLQVRAITLEHGSVSATAASGNGGNIFLQAPETLLLRHGSQISATAGTAFGGGNGGNISIDNTVLVIAFPTENSDISANAFRGNGGSVQINAAGIFGIQPRPADTPLSAITASSTDGGINGVVNLNTLDVDPSRALVALPVILADTSKQIASGCAAGNGTTGSRFVVTGRGGLPSNPSEPLSSEAVWSDTRFVAATGKPQHKKQVSAPQPSASAEVTIVPATGWVFNGKGDVTLTASVPSERLQVPWLTPASCRAQ